MKLQKTALMKLSENPEDQDNEEELSCNKESESEDLSEDNENNLLWHLNSLWYSEVSIV